MASGSVYVGNILRSALVSDTGVNYLVLDDGRQVVAENGILCSSGQIPGHSSIRKFGETGALALNTVTDVWDYSATEARYTYSTTADIDTVSSSNGTDTQDVIVSGLDTNWNIVNQTVTLDGQNKVVMSTPLIRVYRLQNDGATDFAGNIYVYPDTAITNGVPNDTTTVRAFCNNGNNQTLMAIMPVPVNKKAYLLKWFCTLSGKTTANVIARLFYRPFGKVFQLKESVSILGAGSSSFQYEYKCPLEFNEKGDFAVTANSSAVNAVVSAGFDLEFVDQ